MTLKVFYPSRVVTLDTLTTKKIITSLQKIRGTIINVQAAAYASIDGDMSENHALARERINQFMAVVKPYLDTVKVRPQLFSKEQWELFSQQIEAHHLFHLRRLHKSDLRTYVNEHKGDSLISRLLAEQRFTLFPMVITYDSLVPLPPERAVEAYYRQKKKFEALEKKTASHVAMLEKAQLKAYQEIIANNQGDTLEIITSDRYPVFQYHDVMFHYLIRHSITDQQLYRQLHNLAQSRHLPVYIRKQLLFNNLVLIYRNYNRTENLASLVDINKLYCIRYRKSEFLLRRYKRTRCKRDERLFSDQYYILKKFPQLISLERSLHPDGSHIDSLSRFYTASMIQALYGPVFPREIFTYLANVKPLFHPDDRLLSVEQRVRLASFYCAMNKRNVAKSLLLPVIDDPDLNSEGRKLFITLQADAYKNEHEFIEYLISQVSSLGKKEWCGIWTEGRYLSHVLLEDTKLKKFYNCQCQTNTKDR